VAQIDVPEDQHLAPDHGVRVPILVRQDQGLLVGSKYGSEPSRHPWLLVSRASRPLARPATLESITNPRTSCSNNGTTPGTKITPLRRADIPCTIGEWSGNPGL
jgi:hypothetical protein